MNHGGQFSTAGTSGAGLPPVLTSPGTSTTTSTAFSGPLPPPGHLLLHHHNRQRPAGPGAAADFVPASATPFFAQTTVAAGLAAVGTQLTGGPSNHQHDVNPRQPVDRTSDGQHQQPQRLTEGPAQCAACHKAIQDRYLLRAIDQLWHEDCLKCACCDCRLGEVGHTLHFKANRIFCKRDYLRLFGTTGYCSACDKVIPAFEMVMKARDNVYHLECFACQICNHRFCVGDKFYLVDNKILCEYDYEERMVFANMASNNQSFSQIKQRAQQVTDDESSGYGSPGSS